MLGAGLLPRSIMGLVVRLVEPSVSDDQRWSGTDFLGGWGADRESGPAKTEAFLGCQVGWGAPLPFGILPFARKWGSL